MNRPIYYTLDGHQPVPCQDVETYIAWLKSQPGLGVRHVGLDFVGCPDVEGSIRVSTVFLAIDHQWADGPPLLFETMVFGGPMDQFQRRYSTWEEAEAGHNETLAKVQAGLRGLI